MQYNNGGGYWRGDGYSGNNYHPSSNNYQANSFENNQRFSRDLPVPSSLGYEGLNFDNQSNRDPSTFQRNYSSLIGVSKNKVLSEELRPVIKKPYYEGMVTKQPRKNRDQDSIDELEDDLENGNTGYFRDYKIGELLDLTKGRLVQLTGKFIYKKRPRYGGFQDDTGYVQVYVNRKSRALLKVFRLLENKSQMTIRGKLANRDRRFWDHETRNGKIEIKILQLPTKIELQREAAQIEDLLNRSVIPKISNATRDILFTEAAKRGPGNITFLRAFETRKRFLQKINRLLQRGGLSAEELAMANRKYQTIAADQELNSYIDRQLKIREILGISPPKIIEDNFGHPLAGKRKRGFL